ncbi:MULTISPECIES: amidohydrolase family protein [unclassified Wenzhouxiangella]|uniref:metal-dependent hydrolase family protein n=1 Tax=unclassified Wenzhouxiangella TaxID=2613841 RepID=UPI000E32A6A9|nr:MULTISPECIES: amidohydrolase family protein [unclassified Wenzhouxiangella]RFF28510.1 amidohydrolase family protein [Wenzhouxiangella sp. 15181]RFP70028.1 amidohydrolase family protein [Wenzhouxiangella sp. 15190]
MNRLLVFVGLVAISGAALGETWVRCGGVVDVEAGERLGAHTVVVADGKVSELRSGHPEWGEGVEQVDLSSLTCMPGLMDMHTHLTSQSSRSSYIERFTLNEADVALRGADYARKTLEAGFTTVRDLGDSFNASIALRDAINADRIPGPRIFTSAKSLATTGGHADPTNGWRRDLAGDPGPREGVLNGVAEARAAVRQRYKDGADLIKVTATGGVLSVASSGENAQFRMDELEAVIETAADYGFHVAAHTHGAEGMKRAVEAGIHSIEHGTYMTDEIMGLMIEKGTWYVPTISAGKFVAEKAEEEGYFPPVVAEKASRIGPVIQETFSRAHTAGVPIAFGTDCGVCPHGTNAREFGYMVEAGMSPADALRSSTIHAAELLGREDELGRLQSGYAADLIAVDGNPLEDVDVLNDVRFVMRDGRIFVDGSAGD